jgi:hypothetical protein
LHGFGFCLLAGAGVGSGAGSGVGSATTTGSGAGAAAPAERLRKAVTSPPVGTMLTMDQPSADFSVSLAARAAGSKDEALTVANSCMAAQ